MAKLNNRSKAKQLELRPIRDERDDIVRLLRVKREFVKLSQRALAGQIGTSQKALWEYENGVTDPQLATLLRWARALDVRILPMPRYEAMEP